MSKLLKEKILLKEYSNYKIGGPADYFLEFENIEELKAGLTEWQSLCQEKNLDYKKIFILGGGNNVLFSDAGFRGLVIHNSINFIRRIKDDLLEIGSGTKIEEINNYCIDDSLSGLEWSGGLPGTLGGAIFGNAGAFNGETKDCIIEVKSYDLFTQEEFVRPKNDCQFEYRGSIYKNKQNHELITSAIIKLEKGRQDSIRKEIEDKIDYRNTRQPLEYPSLGSTFKNISLKDVPPETIELCKAEIKTDPFPVIPVAYLIHLSGLAGKQIGGAKISEKHPNFILNIDNATAKDIKDLVSLVQKTLANKFGVKAETEVREIS